MRSQSAALPLFLLLIPLLSLAQTADQIMAKVAENQSRAEAARKGFVYQQNVLVRLQRADGKLAREELRDYTVTPEPSGIRREMVHFSGKYGVNGKVVAFSEPGEKYKDADVDADIARSMADDFGNDQKSRDGINQDLFPLTADKQKGYIFRLAREEDYHDRRVFRIIFEPRPKSVTAEEEPSPWAGEVLVDKADLTPALITTHLAHGVPLLVKTLLGTNLQQTGFKVAYSRFDEGLWFPVNYSGELKIRVLFLYARTISLGVINSGFQRADISSSITYENHPAEQ